MDSDDRSTPLELFNPLNEEFHFQLDVCADAENTKCEKFFYLGMNGLKQCWAPLRCFMNPPFSNISAWLYKARYEASRGALVVAILPNDSSTKWFHEYIWDKIKNEFRVPVRFPDKRYAFGDYTNSSKFAILIAIFGMENYVR